MPLCATKEPMPSLTSCRCQNNRCSPQNWGKVKFVPPHHKAFNPSWAGSGCKNAMDSAQAASSSLLCSWASFPSRSNEAAWSCSSRADLGIHIKDILHHSVKDPHPLDLVSNLFVRTNAHAYHPNPCAGRRARHRPSTQCWPVSCDSQKGGGSHQTWAMFAGWKQPHWQNVLNFLGQ